LSDEPIPAPTFDPTYKGVPVSVWASSLGDADPDTSVAVMTSLVLLGDIAVPHVERVYRKGNLIEQSAASTVLASIVKRSNSQAALAALKRGANATDPKVRMQAMISFTQCGPAARAALPVIEEAVACDPDPRVVKLAKEALAAVQGK
jgi:hypothetical protein